MPRTHHTHCQICGKPILFGWHCVSCVTEHRVCQMCGNDISARAKTARTCSPACKESRKRKRKKTKTQPDVLLDKLNRIEAMLQQVLNTRNTPGTGPVKPIGDINIDAVEISTRRENGKENNSSYNMLISLHKLNGKVADLPPEVKEYGIRTGRLKNVV